MEKEKVKMFGNWEEGEKREGEKDRKKKWGYP